MKTLETFSLESFAAAEQQQFHRAGVNRIMKIKQHVGANNQVSVGKQRRLLEAQKQLFPP